MTVITPESNLGGQRYPFLHGTDWRIVSEPIQNNDEWLAKTLLRDDMSLRFAKGDKVTDIYCDGLSVTDFLSRNGLEVNVNKGPFVTSKRLSRIFRPYFLWAFPKRLTVKYDSELDTKLWDGAGLVSRKFLRSLKRTLSHLPRRKQAYLKRELETLKRVEFTILTSRGQDKGHAYVVEDMAEDFILPEDTKEEVKLHGRTFVGIMPVHSSDHMNLDVQSHINLHPFFGTEDLKAWLEAEADLFLKSIESGDLTQVMARIDTTDEVEGWWVREYLASGGDAMWFASVVKSLAAQHSNKIVKTNIDKFKLPIPGGRYYIFADVVGGRNVPSGEIELDPESATAWVSREDYADIAGILGGADQDDALWIFPFTDVDGEKKILAWRSPNQLGEYVILKPSANSHTIQWATAEEPISFPPMDSSLLPPQIHDLGTTYGDAVVKVKTEKGPYTLDAMNRGIRQMIDNAGTLGMTCNLLMTAKAIYGTGPRYMPAKLEQIIDASQKTGDDLSQVKAWVFESANKLVRHRPALPAILHDRIQGLVGDEVELKKTTDHWLDEVVAMARTHLHSYHRNVQAMMNRTMPPTQLLEQGHGWTELAGQLRERYSNTINHLTQPTGWLKDEDTETIRELLESWLDQWPVEVQRHILMGALSRIYLTHRQVNNAGEERISDAMCWWLGKKDEFGRAPGIADRMLEALRYFGVLEELVDTPDGVMRYTRRPKDVTVGQPVRLNGVWFSEALTRGTYEAMRDVPKVERDTIKAMVAEQAQAGRYNGTTYRVTTQMFKGRERKVLVDESGRTFAFVQPTQEYRVGETAEILHAVAHDGNLFAIVR